MGSSPDRLIERRAAGRGSDSCFTFGPIQCRMPSEPATAQGPIRVREVTLPGVGKKYVFPLDAGGNVAVIVKPDGERQIYHFQDQADRPCDSIQLEPDEAQQLANLLGGAMVASPDLEKLELALGALDLQWLEIDEDAHLAGKTLAEVPLRSETGASVIAILRGNRAIPNPGIHTPFEIGDTVLVVGSPKQCDAAREVIQGSE